MARYSCQALCAMMTSLPSCLMSTEQEGNCTAGPEVCQMCLISYFFLIFCHTFDLILFNKLLKIQLFQLILNYLLK